MSTFGTLLVANRGEIASRVMRTARSLGIGTVAVFSDADANSPFVREADEAVRLPGSAPQQTYLNIDRIVEAALRTGAEAIHPGYGFLSENADFARACDKAALVFVGPPAAAIEAMSSKIAAKARMEAAGVPVMPSATVTPEEPLDFDELAEKVGVPVLVKAAYGGGGRGMRIVDSASDLGGAVDSAVREAASAFGNGTVFVERLLHAPRHIEVQIVGDAHGNVATLFERECSIQRRYQKIIEECPSPAVDHALRARLSEAAAAAGQAIGYQSAGTVEFLLDRDGSFYFLEMNTRLQVEHPVTEMVTGLDLVELQLHVAGGDALPPEVFTADIRGHAVEARLYAEDVPGGFLPASGTLHRFRVPERTGVRVDSGVKDGSEVSVHYDAMIAKVVAHGASRTQACARLARALDDAELHGVVTNRDLLVRILREPEFLAGQTDTAYLERHDPVALGAPLDDVEADRMHAAAAVIVAQHQRRQQAGVAATLPSGWRNVPNQPQRTILERASRRIQVDYRVDGVRVAGAVDDVPFEFVVHEVDDHGAVLESGGIARRFAVHRTAGRAFVDSPFGSTAFAEPARFPLPGDVAAEGSLLAPMPATVHRVAVSVGDRVAAGDEVLVLEAMKMEHTVRAPSSGVVTDVHVSAGDQVDSGVVLAVVTDDAGDGP